MQFDIVLKSKFSGTEIEYGIIRGNNTILFIKSGQDGSIYGYNNKYFDIAKNINSKYGSTVICSSNPFNGINPLDDAMKVIEEYSSDMNFDDYQIYYVGNSNGGIIGARWGYLYPKIKRMLLLNAPLMINLHHTKNGLRQFVGDKIDLVYGDKDPSYRYVGLLDNINSNLEYHIALNQDHHFSNGKNPIYDFIKKYMYEINSHKYIAESILKKYSNVNKEVTFYDFSDNIIKSLSVSRFNTEYNHYWKSNEILLSKNVEQKIGRLIKKIESFNKVEDITLNEQEINVLRKYMGYQMIRDDATMDFIKNGLLEKVKLEQFPSEEQEAISDMIDYLKNNSIREIKNEFIEIENECNIFSNALNICGIILRINTTDRNYLLTTGVVVENNNTTQYKMSISLTPKIMLTACDKSIFPTSPGFKNYFTCLNDDKAEYIEKYNESVFNRAERHNPNILVGIKKDLENVLKN